MKLSPFVLGLRSQLDDMGYILVECTAATRTVDVVVAPKDNYRATVTIKLPIRIMERAVEENLKDIATDIIPAEVEADDE